MGPCSRTPSGPAVSIDCINRPDRRLHPTNATAPIYLLQCGSHPQRTLNPSELRRSSTKIVLDLRWGSGRVEDLLKKAKEKAAATYDAAADHFDDEPLGFWHRIGKRTVTNLRLPAGAKVLDVGCGTGASALPAAHAVGKSGFVVGIDLSSRLLERARAKARADELANVEFRIADMTALEYPDASFDAVAQCFLDFLCSRYGRPRARAVAHGAARRNARGDDMGPSDFEPADSRWLGALRKECPDLVTAFNPWGSIQWHRCRFSWSGRSRTAGGVTDAEVIPEDSFQSLRSAEDWWTIALGSGLRWTIDQMGTQIAARVKADNVGSRRRRFVPP